AGNYTANSTASTAANISQLSITVTAVTDSKTYDGATSSTGTPGISPALVGGDSSGFTQTFANRNAGIGNKVISPSGSVTDGNSGNNYALTFATASGSITARALLVSALGVNRSYDGTTAAAVTLSDNRISGDVFTDSYTSASFADKNVGNGKPVNVAGIS